MIRALPIILLLPLWLTAEEMKVVMDRDLLAGLKEKSRFENIDDKLFRNHDGTEFYIGPGPEREFFVFEGMDQMKELKAPSTGKAYLNTNGEFTVWYNRIDQGVHFKDGSVLKFDDPTRARFGVAYGGEYFYVYENLKSRVCSVDAPKKSLLEREDFYIYKLLAIEEGFIILGYEQGGLSRRRENICLELTRTGDSYTETRYLTLPKSDVVLDVDPFGKKVLLLNQSRLAAQILVYDMEGQTRKALGRVDAFAIYLNKDFKTQRDLLRLR